MSSEFEQTGSETPWEGGFFSVEVGRFRHADGEEVTRELVRHSGAVGIVAHDDLHVWLVRQPREATGEPDLLEIPAGKLDIEGEEAEAAARRELAEEIGKAAGSWRALAHFYSSPGFTDEQVHVFLATELVDAPGEAQAEEDERIDVVAWPLDRLDEAIAQCHDAKSLIGLLWLAALRRAGG